MTARVTLSIDEDLLARAEAFARKTGKTLSELVADYFAALDQAGADADAAATLPPLVDSLCGVLRGTDADIEAYRRHQLERPK